MSQSGHLIDDTPPFSPVCQYCVHLHQHGIGRTCDAFPEKPGIPLTIWRGKDDHTTPHDGDRGIIFKQDPASKYGPFAKRVATPEEQA